MNDSNEKQRDINIGRIKSIETVRVMNSGQPGEPLRPTTPVTRRKGWHFVSLIVLMPLGAIGIILFLLRSALAQEFEGIGAALCVVTCGGFLVLHAIHMFAEEDKIQDQLLKVNQVTGSSSEPNPAGLQADPTAQRPGTEEGIKYRKP